jgi:O-antigen/teichoic acid export membrane protein
VLLERQLAFDKLVIPQIVETLGFYCVAVYLAWKGFGIESFTWAVLVRAVTGLVAIYIVKPWMPVLTISKESTKRLISFGLPYQLNSFMALLKDDLLTVFLGKVLPLSHVGYIGWAKKWAEVPLRLIMDSVIRVTFPAYSRLQHDKASLSKAIEKTIYGLALTIFPISTGLLFFIGPLIDVIPKYNKWEPALVSFYLFVFSSALAALSTPLINTLNAVGKIRTTLVYMVIWTSLTWILTAIFLRMFGFNGVALALLVITGTIYFVVRSVKQLSPFSFGSNVLGPLISAVIQGVFYWIALANIPHSYGTLIIVAVVGCLFYASAVYLLEKDKLRALWSSIRRKHD